MGYPSRRKALPDELFALEARCSSVNGCLVVPVVGYGEVRSAEGRMGAHRAAYIVHNGPIPDGLVVRHTCDRIGCINPQHLILGTTADNNRDAWERDRIPTGEQHHRASLSSSKVRSAVLEYLKGGQSQAEVARKYGVSQTTLGTWVRASFRKDAGTPPFLQGKGRTALARGGLLPCGTRGAYGRHVAAGEPPCDACAEANRTYMRKYKQARRLRKATT